MEIKVGARVTMRKPHACGANDWEVTRTGADIGIRCAKCGRRVMLPREQFERQARRLNLPE
jgi:hypothetical protein